MLLARGSSFHDFKLLQLLERRPNISFLERPVPKRTLISVLRSAVEARRLQYDVRDALHALQLADRKKDEFLATLAHELRNPLVPIRNGIYVLKQSLGGDPPPGSQTPKLISLMERQVDHLVRLVDDLLEISRITTGKIVLRKARVDLAAVIGQAIEISEPLIRSQQHQLSLDLDEEPLPVEGDQVRLAQVFANLLNNAAKYTPPGGRIHVASRSEGDQAVIRVSGGELVSDAEIGDLNFIGTIDHVKDGVVYLLGKRWMPNNPHCCPSTEATLAYNVLTKKHVFSAAHIAKEK